MKNVKRVIKLASFIGMGVVLAACSSTNKSASVENGFGSGVSTQGLGNNEPFLSSSYMSKVVGVDKNTIYFNFDQSMIPSKYQNIVQANANYLKSHRSAKLRLEGNTDPRGSREYNIGLGQRRASSVAEQLEILGVSPSQIVTVSYGEERPAILGNSSEAYRLDRRVDLVYMSK